MENYITPIVTVLSVFISFGLGIWTKTRDFRKSQLEKRYINFYIPFLSKLLRYQHTDNSPYELLAHHGLDIINLISNNIQFLSINEVTLYKDLYWLAFRCIEFSTGKYPENEKYVQDFNRKFDEFIIYTKISAGNIAKNLKLESISKSI